MAAPAAQGQTPAHKRDLSGGEAFCGLNHDQESLQAAVRAIAARKAVRAQTAFKAEAPPDIGDRRQFRVYIYASNRWSAKEFELRDKTGLYHAWVEVANLSAINDSKLASIRQAMLVQTPSGSVNPSQGVMVNIHDVFGQPPNFDGDGIVDFLFYDIDNQNVGGFVSSADLAIGTGGNERDVLHLDVFQSVSFMPRLIAHEYTHLVHFNYQFDVETFVSEGLAEYAMVVNGYTQDNFQYLGFPSEQARPLFSWRGVDSPNGGRDYDRGRLFFSYLGDQVGPRTTGSMVRMKKKGAAGLDSVLVEKGLSLGRVIANFHTANWVMDTDVDPAFGYTRPFSVQPTVLAGQNWDASAMSFTPEVSDSERPTVQAGAVNYIRWSQLANLDISFDAVVSNSLPDSIRAQVREDMRARLRGRIVATRDDDRKVWTDLRAAATTFRLKGNYKEVRLIVSSGDPIKTATYAVDAGWRSYGTATATEPEVVPPGTPEMGLFPNPVVSTGHLTWSQDRATDTVIQVVDALGRRVSVPVRGFFPAGAHVVPLDVSHLPSGAYLVILETGGIRASHSLVVVR